MSTIALSLFLFNLLPLPHTDGSQLLKSALSLYAPRLPPTISLRAALSNPGTPGRSGTPAIKIHFEPHERDAEAYELDTDDELEENDQHHEYGGGGAGGGGGGGGGGSGRREGMWKRRVRRGVEGVVLGLGAGWAAGWGMLVLLRSS